ncbi:MAG: cysteine hydrolase [Solirubrobacterales bacterium]|nr:cysteine hydrolase [Solirubrobacterales bacterium]
MYCYTPAGERKLLPAEKVFDDWLDPETSAIACVDMHRSHVGDDPDMPVPAPRATERVDAHNAFHAAAREVGVPVIMVQHWQRHGGTDDIKSHVVEGGTNWRHLEKIYMNLDPKNMDELGWEGTKWVDLMVEEDPRDLYVRTKKRLSSFYPTDLEFLLRQMGVANLIIDGTLTDCCVLNTAFDAANRDFRVVVPRDVAAGMSEEMEGAAEKVIANHLGLIVDAPAVLREWYARKGVEVPPALAEAETMDDVTAVKA